MIPGWDAAERGKGTISFSINLQGKGGQNQYLIMHEDVTAYIEIKASMIQAEAAFDPFIHDP